MVWNNQSEDYVDSPLRFTGLLVAMVAVLVMMYIMITNICGKANQNALINFTSGVSKGMKAYSVQYRDDYENMASLAEGYLIEEDLKVYSVNANPVNIDVNRARTYLYKILSGNTGIPMSKVKTWDITIVHISTFYKLDALDQIEKMYKIQMYDKNGNETMNFTTENLGDIQGLVQDNLDVVVDINVAMANSIHKAQVYDREGAMYDGSKTVTTYNTYMFIGRDIPTSDRFMAERVDFCELQTYSVER